MAIPRKKEFSTSDLKNLCLISHLYKQNSNAIQVQNDASQDISIKEKLFIQKQVTESIRDLTKLLSIFSEDSPPSRLWCKELQIQHLNNISKQSQLEKQLKDQQKKNDQGSSPKKFNYKSNILDKLNKFPHIKTAFQTLEESKPDLNILKESSNISKFNALSKPTNPNAQLVKDQIGISISSGNYINTKVGANQFSTYQTLQAQAQADKQNFYANNFNLAPPNQNQVQLPDFLQKFGNKRKYNDTNFEQEQQNLGINYQPPFKVGTQDNIIRKDNKMLDQMYKHYGDFNNLSKQAQERIQKIIDQTDGADLDLNRVAKHFEKNKVDFYDNNKSDFEPKAPQGFISAQKQLKMDFQKKKQGLTSQGYYDNNYNNYNSNSNPYQRQGWGNQDQATLFDDDTATDKLFNNNGRQPGLGGRRKFVPPTKGSQGYSNNNGANASFHPGRSVTQHMLSGNNKEENKVEELQDERYKNLDPRMVELIENEIMEKQINITWNDIAGLEFAKKTINEIIVLPMIRPDIFKGIRAPPRGILFFGPPGTGKTLLGKAIAAQSKSTFMSISASTLTSKWVGEGEKMVRTMFAIAAIHQPSIVFIDEIDSLLCSRNESDMESSRRIKTEFLVQLDGANTFAGENARILIIGATNRPYDLDEAVRRRLGKRLYIPLPNQDGRRQFIKRMIEQEQQEGHKINLSEDQVENLVQLTKGYSGADLKALCAEAAMIPLRSISDITNIDINQIRALELGDFTEALNNVKATVNQNDLNKFLDWNDSYGTFPMKEEDLKD